MTSPQPGDATPLSPSLAIPPAPAVVPTTPAPESMRITLPGDANPQERWLWRGLLAVLCLLAYVPALSPFFLWDDDRHAGMTRLRDSNGLVAIWTRLGLENGGTPQYYPLTHTTYWLEYQVFRGNAIGFHVVNILIHAGAAVLLWEVLKRLRVPGAFLAAIVFALHPVMAESVAWTSERKNTLSLLLALTSIFFYLRFVNLTGDARDDLAEDKSTPPDWNLYILSAVAFLGALLSKTVAGSAPIVLLLILWWKRRLTARHIGLIAPFILVALALSTLTAYTEYAYVIRPGSGASEMGFTSWLSARLSGTLPVAGREFDMPLSQRFMLAGMVPWFYAFKLVLPLNLIFFYPRWDFDNAPAFWWLGLAGLVAVLATCAFLATRGKRWPLVVALGYLVALFPAMGFVDVYPFRYSYVADHFAYHADVLLIVALCVGLTALAPRLIPRIDARQTLALAAVLCVALAARTYVHAGNFYDKFALWDHTFKKNPASWAAAHNLAVEYLNDAIKAQNFRAQFIARREPKLAEEANLEAREKLAKARNLLQTTLTLNPDHDVAHYTLGKVAALEGNADEALANYYKSIDARTRLKSRDGPLIVGYIDMGDIYRSQNRWDLAVEFYSKAIAAECPPLTAKFPQVRTLLLEVLIKSVNADISRRQALMGTTLTGTTRPTADSGPTGNTSPSSLPTTVVTTSSPTTASLTTTAPTTSPSTRATLAGPTNAQVTALIDAARNATDAEPKNTRAWMLGAQAMVLISYPLEAVKAYEQAIRLDVANVDAIIGYGRMLGVLGDIEGSRASFLQALNLSPNRADARQLLEITTDLLLKQRAAATRPVTRTSTAPATRPVTQPVP